MPFIAAAAVPAVLATVGRVAAGIAARRGATAVAGAAAKKGAAEAAKKGAAKKAAGEAAKTGGAAAAGSRAGSSKAGRAMKAADLAEDFVEGPEDPAYSGTSVTFATQGNYTPVYGNVGVW